MDSERIDFCRRQIESYPNNGGKQCDCNAEDCPQPRNAKKIASLPQPYFNEPAAVVESLIEDNWEGHIPLILKHVFFYVQMAGEESLLQRQHLLNILAESQEDYIGLLFFNLMSNK